MVACQLIALALAATTSPDTVTVKGKVLDPDGRPLANAKVYVLEQENWDMELVAKVKTDRDGLFEAKAQRSADPWTWYRLISISEPYAFAIGAQKPGEPSELRHSKASEVSVKLLLPDGQPAAGVRLEPDFAMTAGQPGQRAAVTLPPDIRERLGVVTDEKGIALVRGLPSGSTVRLRVSDERFAQLDYTTMIKDIGHGTKEHVIHLKHGCTVTGRVLDDHGKPVEGIAIGAQGTDEPGWGAAKSERDGSFRLTQLLPGTYNIALDLRNGQELNWTAVAHEKVTLSPNEETTGIVFRLIKGSVVEGTVTDEKGKPGARVMVGVYGPARPDSGAWVQSAMTDANGRYSLRVPAGKQRVYIMGWPDRQVEPQKSYIVETKDGQRHTLDLKLAISAEPGGFEVSPIKEEDDPPR